MSRWFLAPLLAILALAAALLLGQKPKEAGNAAANPAANPAAIRIATSTASSSPLDALQPAGNRESFNSAERGDAPVLAP